MLRFHDIADSVSVESWRFSSKIRNDQFPLIRILLSFETAILESIQRVKNTIFELVKNLINIFQSNQLHLVLNILYRRCPWSTWTRHVCAKISIIEGWLCLIDLVLLPVTHHLWSPARFITVFVCNVSCYTRTSIIIIIMIIMGYANIHSLSFLGRTSIVAAFGSSFPHESNTIEYMICETADDLYIFHACIPSYTSLVASDPLWSDIISEDRQMFHSCYSFRSFIPTC